MAPRVLFLIWLGTWLPALSAPPPREDFSSGQGARLWSRWSADTVHIGEPVSLFLRVELPPGAVPHFPRLDLENPDADLVDTHLEPDGAAYVFTFWRVGRVVLPGVPVKYTLLDGTERTLATDSLRIVVASVLTGGEEDIRGIKRMVPLKLTEPWFFWVRVAGILVLVTLVVLLWRTRRRAIAAARERNRPDPEEEARRALEELQAAPYRPKEAERYYLELSRVVRGYLERRFPFRALEMTTTEIQEVLKAERVDPATCGIIARVLEHSDLAKFADRRHPGTRWRGDLELAEKILDRTRRTFKI